MKAKRLEISIGLVTPRNDDPESGAGATYFDVAVTINGLRGVLSLDAVHGTPLAGANGLSDWCSKSLLPAGRDAIMEAQAMAAMLVVLM